MSFIKVEEKWMKLTNVTKINYGEILLLSKINSLCNNDNRACTASNAYFAKVLCTTERNIQRYLEKLKTENIVKTFEKREGMKTTTRYIYPQYEHINSLISEPEQQDNFGAHDNNVMGDNSGNSTRQNWLEHTTELVKTHDESVTQIKEEKRRKENIREDASGEAVAADASTILRKEKWIPKDVNSKEIFGSTIHTDEKVMDILDNSLNEGKEINEIKKMTCFLFTSTSAEKIEEYCNDFLINNAS